MMMRALTILLFTLSLAGAGHIGWYGDYDRALEMAQKSGRPMLVVLVKRSCAPCGRLVASLADHEALSRLIDEKTVPVLVTQENGDYPIELLYTLEYPTLFLLSPEENFLMAPMRGETDPSLLRRRLEKEVFDER
jgi:hypothetical protein